jgi:hypothetical protein
VTDSHETRALAIIPRTVGELMQLAEILSKSELLPKALRGKVADVAMTMMAGAEMGFGPGASLRNINVIDGKPVLSASGKVALVRASGKCKYFDCIEDTDDRVTYETLRIDATRPRRSTWTKQRVKDAGLNTKDNHRLFSKQMLDARAKSELCENTYEDVLAGIATAELVGEWVPPTRNEDAVDAEIVNETPEPVPMEIQALEHTKSEAECKEYGKVLAKLPEKWRAKANDAYKARLKYHRENPTAETTTEGAA